LVPIRFLHHTARSKMTNNKKKHLITPNTNIEAKGG
jgi:hypothetical protein